MSFEREFDRIIKQKIQLGGGDVPFDEQNWANAQKMIDAQRAGDTALKATSYSKLFLIAGVIGVIGVSVFFVNSNGTSSNKKSEVVTNFTKSKSDQTNTAIVSNDKVENLNFETNKGSLINNVESSQSGKIETKLQTLIASDKIAEAGENTILNAISQKEVKVSKEINAGKIEDERSIVENSNSSNKSDLNQTIADNTEAVASSASLQFDLTVPVKENKPALPEQNNFIDSELKENNSAAKFEYLNQCALLVFNIDTNLKEGSFTYVRSYDNTFKSQKAKTHFLNFGGGLSYLNGWSSPQGKDGSGLNYFANLNYGFYITKNLIISSGFDVYNIQNIKYPFYTHQKTEYSFGSTNTYTSVSSNNLVYVGIPIKFYYDLSRSVVLHAGALPSFLIRSTNTLQTYNLQDGNKVNIVSHTNHDLYTAVSQKNIQLMFGINTKISERIWLQADAMYGITDLFADNSSNKGIQSPIGIRLGALITLFDK